MNCYQPDNIKQLIVFHKLDFQVEQACLVPLWEALSLLSSWNRLKSKEHIESVGKKQFDEELHAFHDETLMDSLESSDFMESVC